MQCSQSEEWTRDVYFVEFRDDGNYEFVCPNGHEIKIVLQQQKFEILFEIGAYAILDGYYREAISSFSASLERFNEFAVRVLLRERALSVHVINEAWKKVAIQSERQLGAFLFLWINSAQKMPALMPDNDVMFRNSVIHKGQIPTKEQALAFGNTVLGILRSNIADLFERHRDSIHQEVMDDMRKRSGKAHAPRQSISMSTIVSLLDSTEKTGDLQHHLRRLEAALAMWRAKPH
jgi:hypothetical protein